MNTHHCFCSMNAKGVDLLRAGQPEQAACILSLGLKQIKQTIKMAAMQKGTAVPTSPQEYSSFFSLSCDVCHQASNETQRTQEHNQASTPLSAKASSSATMEHDKGNMLQGQPCSSSSSREDEDEKEAVLFNFSCPIDIPSSATCNDLSVNHLSYIMIYNLALSFDGMASSNIGTNKHARSALSFYQLANQVQSNSQEAMAPMLYSCGMLNNMARLFFRLQNKKAADECLASLTSILMYYLTRKQAQGGETSEQETYYLNKFLSSASSSVLRGPPTARAA